MTHITILILFGLIFGTALLGKFFIQPNSKENTLELYIIRATLGLGVLSLIIFFVSLFTTQVSFLLLLFIIVILRIVLDYGSKRLVIFYTHYYRFQNFFQILLFSGIAILLLEFGMLADTYTISWDATTHHYLVPQIWLDAGRIIPIPEVVFAEYPSNIQLLYMIGLQAGNEIHANMVCFVIGLMLCIAIFVFTLKHLNFTGALIAVLIFISMPLVIELFTGGMIDIGYSLFCFMSFWMFIKYRDNDNKSFLYLSAIFAGFALGSKHLASQFIVAMLAAVFIFDIISKRFSIRRLLSDSLIYIGIAFLLASPWYIKSLIHTGNPIHPFLPAFFNGLEKTSEPISVHAWSHPEYARTIISLITYPWKITTDFSFLHFWIMAISPLFLGTVPLWWYYRKRFSKPFFPITIVFVIIFMLIAYQIAPSSTRYMFPLLCVLAVLSGMSLSFLVNDLKRMGKVIVVVLLIIPFILNAVVLAKRIRDAAPFDYSMQHREQVLMKKFPDYKAIKWVNENLPDDAIVISTDPKGYLFEKQFYIATPGVQSQKLPPWSEEDSMEILKWWQELGITHLLFNISSTVMKNSYFVYTVTKGIEEQGELRMDSRQLSELTRYETDYFYHPHEIDEFGRITQTPFEMVDGSKRYILQKDWWERTVEQDRTQFMLGHYLNFKPYLDEIKKFDQAIVYRIDYPEYDLNND